MAVGSGPSLKGSEALFSVALFPRWVNLFFLRGAGLPDPSGRLRGEGKQARRHRIASADEFDAPDLLSLLESEQDRHRVRLDGLGQGRLVIVSISSKQRPRRPGG